MEKTHSVAAWIAVLATKRGSQASLTLTKPLWIKGDRIIGLFGST